MNIEFTNKTVIVTGAAHGFGRAIALAFAQRGALVWACDRLADELAETARLCAEAGGDCTARAVDVTDRDAVWAFVREAEASNPAGRIDILVNNAGMSPACPSHEMSESLFDSVLNLNFKGPFRLASQVAKRMADGEGGSIINISSSGSLVPLPHVVPYGSAKAAINAMSLSLAHEYAPKVRVNTICPGPFLTDIAEAWAEEKRVKQPVAMGRPGYPEEIVTAALMLASPHSSYTTATLVRVDGGQ